MKKLFPLIILISFACSRETISLTDQKIVVRPSDPRGRYYLYYPFSDERYILRFDSLVHFSALNWTHTTDQLIGNAYKQSRKYGTVGGNILRFNREGIPIDTVYACPQYEIPGSHFLSYDDRLLAFTSHIRHPYNPKRPLAGLSEPGSLSVMDMATGKIIMRRDSLASYMQLWLDEWPWLPDNQRFVYSLTRNRFTVKEDPKFPPHGYNPLPVKRGVYLFDIRTMRDTLLVENGINAVSSPVDNKVAFLLDRNIWIMDLNTQTMVRIYKHRYKERINDIHWTPDGKYIYARGFTWLSTDEKLIDVKTKKRFSISHSLWEGPSWK